MDTHKKHYKINEKNKLYKKYMKTQDNFWYLHIRN